MANRLQDYIGFCLILMALIAVAGCGPKVRPGKEFGAVRVPFAMLYENQISGTVFGQKIDDPIGLETDDAGNIYLVDAGNNRLIKFDRDLKPVREAGGFGISGTLFNSPTYAALDNNLNLYVSDAGNQRIAIYDSRLNYVDMISLIDDDDPAKFGRPGGLAFNDYGELWVSDPDNSRVSVFGGNTEFNRFVGDVDSYAGLLLTPNAAAKGGKGRLLVSDEGKGRVYVFDGFGLYLFDFGYDVFKHPAGLKTDRTGHIWVADSRQSTLYCFDINGNLLYSLGTYGTAGEYSFNKPRDVAVLTGDRVAVSDTGNDRVMIYKILYQE